MRTLLTLITSALVVGSTMAVGAPSIPDRPEKLTFRERTFSLPAPEDLRHELSNGVPVYVKKDSTLPLVSIQVLFRGAQYIEPEGKEGLARLTELAWPKGGAGELGPAEFEEALAFLAANLDVEFRSTSGQVSLSLLSKDVKEGLDLLAKLLTQPRFEAQRFEKAREDLLQEMKKRNDDTRAIEERVVREILYGSDYWLNRLSTKASVEGLTPEDARTFVGRMIGAGNLALAVSGDVEIPDLMRLLESTIGAIGEVAEPLPPVPQPTAQAAPGVYLVNKPGVNQGRVTIGHVGYMWNHPRYAPLRVATHVLGAGGFTSRIMTRVRSDEGLAYSAYAHFRFRDDFPGLFRAAFQSKSSTVAAAAKIVFDEIHRIRTEKLDESELNLAKSSLVEAFPKYFDSTTALARIYARDELTGVSHDFWLTYQDRFRAVTVDDAFDAIQRDLHEDQLVMIVVGDEAALLKGHPDYEAKLADFGEIHRVPLRDPMTGEPLASEAPAAP